MYIQARRQRSPDSHGTLTRALSGHEGGRRGREAYLSVESGFIHKRTDVEVRHEGKSASVSESMKDCGYVVREPA